MRRNRIIAVAMAVILLLQATMPAYAQGIQALIDGMTKAEGLEQNSSVSTSVGGENISPAEENLDPLYENGTILLYSYEQLCAVGSGQVVTDRDAQQLGSGRPVVKDGKKIVYSPDAQYRLVKDIELPKGKVWQLPDGFTGRIIPSKKLQDAPLYNEKQDAIYLYHPYQLLTIAKSDAANQPVLHHDWNASMFGIGNLIYPNGDQTEFLTYHPENRYIMSASFCSDMPKLVTAAATQGTTDAWGRDFAGQVIKKINGQSFILVGNAQQLQAIGTGAKVYTSVYQAVKKGLHWEVDKDQNGNPIMLYGGDADLLQSQNGTKNYSFGKNGIDGADGGLLEIVGRCGVNQETGEIDPNMDIEDSGAVYSSNANYIVFRDIDLNDLNADHTQSNWVPLTFSGNMIGAVAENGFKIWDDSSANIIAVNRPVISNARIKQTAPIEVNKYIGVGFFSTISNEVNKNNIGVSSGQVKVSNLEWNGLSVEMKTSETKSTNTILNALTSGLGWIVGGLLDLLTNIITIGNVKLNLRDTLSGLLNARAKDPTRFATGAFAGRIEGDVLIENCVVTNASVQNQNNYTGGFVGYAAGVTRYDGLSDALGLTVNVVSSLLNAIPGLGLGDLITVLLENALPVGHLIPTGYYNPVIQNCRITFAPGNVIGAANTKYNGGFVGAQIGTRLIGCEIRSENGYEVLAESYGGGFSGIARDAEIKGLLTDVGIELIRLAQPQSLLINCSVTAPGIAVSGNDYLGGFAGAMANSYAVNDTISAGKVHVTGSGNCVGGFTGTATVGWISNLGKNEVTDTSLLSTVKELLTDLLSTDPSKAQMLLSLVGIQPSAVMGCQIDGTDVQTAGNSYVGGFVGKGDGMYLTDSSQAHLEKLPPWKWRAANTVIPPAEDIVRKDNVLNGLTSVLANGEYAGGAAGSLGTASVTGLLNGTLGVGNFLGFTAEKISIHGCPAGYSVAASGDYAGGAFGMATGGICSDITIDSIGSVLAKNRAGGFAGCTGPGDLAGSSGLKLGLLGIDLLELKNLLSVAEGVRVRIQNCTVTGVSAGFTVTASGENTGGGVADFASGGLIGKSNSTQVENTHVAYLKAVVASDRGGFAGGYVGTSQTGGLAEVAAEDHILGLIQANNLLGAVKYMIPEYINCTVRYADGGYVQADAAGGFAGEMQSGKVNNKNRGEADFYAVYNLDRVSGQTYGGGFAGILRSGALADAAGGLSILGNISGVSIRVSDLLSLIEAYVPYVQYAGVKSDSGFTVEAAALNEQDVMSGSAGGFAGYTSGAQISYCDVNCLKHTKVTPPDDLESKEAADYFDQSKSSYAVTGGRYAGGYIGCMDIGSAASVGSGLGVLGDLLQLNNVLDALSVVVTTVEHSDVFGAPGGYSILADAANVSGKLGYSGGFAGAVYGGHIQDSHANHFEYIIGQIAAGGYVGEMKPGEVTELMEDAGVLGSLIRVDSALASLLQTFVPTIRNSTTDAVPCGGAVRAQAESDAGIQRGMAGGYVGHNMGGSIWGLNNKPWKAAILPYTGQISICTADRIRSVYGAEYAGGYTGFMEVADTANVGGLEVLNGLISVNNILGALSVIYPVQENTAVYGPLANLDVETWNKWVEYVGKYGGYGYELAQNGSVQTPEELEQLLSKYTYGYSVAAGRSAKDILLVNAGGDAGGYVGLMRSGALTNCMAYDVKMVKGWHASGGYAGSVETGGAADFGTVSILGLKLNVGKLINIAELFVPAIKNSSVQGYVSGMTVQSFGTSKDDAGYAGGFAGCSYGAQIQLNDKDLPDSANWASTQKYPAPANSCDVRNLRRVTGRNAIGGYVGLASAASIAKVDTNASGGLLQGILDHVISSASSLVDLLPATVTTIHKASVSPADAEWGFVVDGAYNTAGGVQYAPYAGGFAGFIQAAVLGERNASADVLIVDGLRSVNGGLYAGGFFGLADVAAVAEVAGTNSAGSTTNILDALVNLGSVDALDVLRTYVYHARVKGIQEGLTVQAHTETSEGIMDEKRYTGCAGGFGGGMMSATVRSSTAEGLSTIQALNYTGGFIGHMGKSGVVDIDSVEILNKLLGATVGASDLFGSQVYDSMAKGYAAGTVVKATAGNKPIAGGFVGYSDLGRVKNCHVIDQKKVASDQVAGGFIGKTDMNYIVSTQVQSGLLEAVLRVVNTLLKALYLNDLGLENIDLADLNLGLLRVELLSDGNTLKVTLLGLPISVALSKRADNPDQQTDVAIITIGDSVIRLPCSQQIGVKREDLENAEINLIKGNRTVLEGCTVTGINNGYDVFGGGASQNADGAHKLGVSGGFVGYNHEGKLSDCTMNLCDVVRGTTKKVGPFSGYNDLKSVYAFNTILSTEGNNNHYFIYRPYNSSLLHAALNGSGIFSDTEKNEVGGTSYNRYDVMHLDKFDAFADLKGALEVGNTGEKRELLVYESSSKAVLMKDMNAPDNPPSTVPEPGENADPCSDTVDLTIRKIWKDWGNFDGSRPNEIKIFIYQQRFAPDGMPLGERVLYQVVTLTKDDLESAWGATWRKVVKGLPAIEYETDPQGVPTDKIKAYHAYSFEEEAIPGYRAEIRYDEKAYEVTVTNKHDPALPDTGGIGSVLFAVVGVGILLPALLVHRRRKGRREAG